MEGDGFQNFTAWRTSGTAQRWQRGFGDVEEGADGGRV